MTNELNQIHIIIDDSDPQNQIFVEVENDYGQSVSVEQYGQEGRSGNYRVIHIPLNRPSTVGVRVDEGLVLVDEIYKLVEKYILREHSGVALKIMIGNLIQRYTRFTQKPIDGEEWSIPLALNKALKKETNCIHCGRKLIGYTSIDHQKDTITRVCQCGQHNTFSYWGSGSIVDKNDTKPIDGGIEEAEILGALARGYCHEDNKNKELDAKLISAMKTEICKLLSQYTRAVRLPKKKDPIHDECGCCPQCGISDHHGRIEGWNAYNLKSTQMLKNQGYEVEGE